jgi:NAD(P)-dependent dehydrogenase (short-subunit alcohol dehydrogenase family)
MTRLDTSRRCAVVTGAGSGIGRAVARALLRHGERVVVAGRRLEELRATVDGWPSESALVVPTDVTSETSVRALFDHVCEEWVRVDLLFNNAGIFGPAVAIQDVDLAQWRAVVDTNLTGAFLCAREAFRVMRVQDPQGGRIINNGSLSAHVPRPYAVAYTASKHAITGLTKALSLEGRRHKIACGQIDVGNAASEMTAAMPSGVRQANAEHLPEPVIDVTHVADAVLYMASLPLDANVLNLTVMANEMPFVGRG